MRGNAILVAAALALGTGCGGLENLGSVLGQPSANTASGQVVAEIRQVDTRSRELHVRTQDGQSASVRYDERTRLIYRDQEYQVTALEPGDVVAMRVQESRGVYYTDHIVVQQSVQERGGGGGDASLRTYEGSVGQIDHSRGVFELRTSGGSLTVTLPYGVTAADADYFRRLRQGDRVRVRGRLVTGSRLELERFM